MLQAIGQYVQARSMPEPMSAAAGLPAEPMSAAGGRPTGRGLPGQGPQSSLAVDAQAGQPNQNFGGFADLIFGTSR